MQKTFSRTGIGFIIVFAVALLTFAPLSSQAAMIPEGGDLGALGNGDSAHFAETGLSADIGFFQTLFEFDYVGTGAIYIAAAAPRLPEDPPFIFGINLFSFTVTGPKPNQEWESVAFSDEVVGRIITRQELADAGIEFGDTMTITMQGDPVGVFPSSYAGDVGVIPIPAAAWLLGGGLIGLVVIRRRLNK